MVKRIVTDYICDICDKENSESHSFLYDRRMDAAGSMENEYYDVDLCPMHFSELVRKNGKPKDYRQSQVGRKRAMQYGYRVKTWIEMQKTIWNKMSRDERVLATKIEQLRLS